MASRPRLRLLLPILLLSATMLWLLLPPARFLLLFGFGLFAPGYLLERRLRYDWFWPAITRPALWLALSLSLWPLLYLWPARLLPLHPTPLALLLLALLFATSYAAWQDLARPSPLAWNTAWPALLLLGVLLLTIGLRFYQARNLALPAWVDSVHHALIIRVVLERGMAPVDLRPYLPVPELPYHWGYHVNLAPAILLSGTALPQAMLLGGQLLNALHVLSVAALSAATWRSRWAGVLAAALAGLVSWMPAFMLSWGRYTLISGLLVAALFLLLGVEWLRRPAWRLLPLTALLAAGLFLIHVIALLFTLAAAGLLLLLASGAAWRRRLLQLAILAAGVPLLVLPELWLLLRRIGAPAAQQPATLLAGGNYSAFPRALLEIGPNEQLFVLAALAFWLLIWERRRLGLVFAAWGPLLLLLANPAVLGLPYLWVFNNNEVLPTLFLPLCVLIGGGMAALWRAWRVRTLRLALVLLSLLLIGRGACDQRVVLLNVTVLANADDAAASAWVAEQTPADARFLVGAARWISTAERGSDGGWWLLPLTGRWVSTPPVMFTYAAPAEVNAIRERTRTIMRLQPGQEAQLRALLEREQITHVYASDTPPLTVDWLRTQPGLRLVYQQGRIAIFAVEIP